MKTVIPGTLYLNLVSYFFLPNLLFIDELILSLKSKLFQCHQGERYLLNCTIHIVNCILLIYCMNSIQ